MVDFSKNRSLILKAVDRAEALVAKRTKKFDRIEIFMDLAAADGVNGNRPIDWDRLNKADDFNFMHDVFGISNHMCRETGSLLDCFLPRFTKQNEAA